MLGPAHSSELIFSAPTSMTTLNGAEQVRGRVSPTPSVTSGVLGSLPRKSDRTPFFILFFFYSLSTQMS